MTSQADIKTRLAELFSDAFEAFCNDISGMFGVAMASSTLPTCTETVKELEKKFKKLTAVITVKGRGVLDGDFHILFDKEGLFTLAGTIVMLPEQRIQSVRKNGTTKDAEELQDAIGETGNLLVGSWDRVFREGLQGHIHLLQTGTFLGNPWDDSQKHIGLPKEEEFLFFPCEITMASFPAFHCGVIFPEAVFHPATEAPTAAPIKETISETVEEPIETPEIKEMDTPVPAKSAEDVTADLQTAQDAGGAVSQTIQKMVQSLPIFPKEQVQTLLSVCAEDIMKKEVLWGDPEDSVQCAMEKMRQIGAACMMVGANGSLEGIVTWIDIAEAISIYLRPIFSKWRRPTDDATLQIRIKIIMTRPVRTITPQTPLATVMEDMCQHRLRCLPVMDTQGHVQGVVTAIDIFKALLKTDLDFSIANRIPQTTASQA